MRGWTEKQEIKLRALYPFQKTREVARKMRRSLLSVKMRAAALHLKKQVGKRAWTSKDDEEFRRLYPDMPTEQLAKIIRRSVEATYNRAAVLGLGKSEAYLASPAACRLRRGDNIGAAYRYKPGNVPANKDLRRPGWSVGRMKETQFRKGNRPHTWKPIGSYRVSLDGYLDQKISDTGYPPRDWRGVHLLMWEKKHGRLPKGHAVIFRDGNRRNIRLSNLKCVSRAELMRRNSIHDRYPQKLKDAVYALIALKRRITLGQKKKHRDAAGAPVRHAGEAEGKRQSGTNQKGYGYLQGGGRPRQHRQSRSSRHTGEWYANGKRIFRRL